VSAATVGLGCRAVVPTLTVDPAANRKWFSQPNDQLATMVAASDLARLYAQAGGAVMAGESSNGRPQHLTRSDDDSCCPTAEQVAERVRRAEDQRVARQAKEEEERKAEWLASGGTIEEWDNGEAEWTEEEEEEEEEEEGEEEKVRTVSAQLCFTKTLMSLCLISVALDSAGGGAGGGRGLFAKQGGACGVGQGC